ncbi:hypothetical protein SBD_2035 [Streptomyces bottropensis ATCC 25435]|uniref:Uncharacterized protein n=1 Tax=Streptomyces bottropensis ATCC 25435 TaxID=1054862 RepID=M3FW66_9ACTN|nr:hypothetical protein SBD_2035 [Streptomyces bottropensis ATCC 25435]
MGNPVAISGAVSGRLWGACHGRRHLPQRSVNSMQISSFEAPGKP